jgi:hypothetical protein
MRDSAASPAPEPVAWRVLCAISNRWELRYTEPRKNHPDYTKVQPLYAAPQPGLQAEVERLTRERDWQYDENVNRIALETAANTRAETAEARVLELERTSDRWAAIAHDRLMEANALRARVEEFERIARALLTKEPSGSPDTLRYGNKVFPRAVNIALLKEPKS